MHIFLYDFSRNNLFLGVKETLLYSKVEYNASQSMVSEYPSDGQWSIAD